MTENWATDFLAAVDQLHTEEGDVRVAIHSSREGADDWDGDTDTRA
jgi:hypothetical protein